MDFFGFSYLSPRGENCKGKQIDTVVKGWRQSSADSRESPPHNKCCVSCNNCARWQMCTSALSEVQNDRRNYIQQTVVRLVQCLPGWLVCKVIGVNSRSDQQTSAALVFSRRLLFGSTFCASAPVCASILRSCLASDTDSSTICLPAAQDTCPPPTVLIIIDSCLCQPTRKNKKKTFSRWCLL